MVAYDYGPDRLVQTIDVFLRDARGIGAHFTAAAGAPLATGKPSGGFRKKEHDGHTWTWTTPTLGVWMLSHVDDTGQREIDISNTLKLSLYKP